MVAVAAVTVLLYSQQFERNLLSILAAPTAPNAPLTVKALNGVYIHTIGMIMSVSDAPMDKGQTEQFPFSKKTRGGDGYPVV